MFLTKWTKNLRGIRTRLTFVYSTLFGLFICTFAYITTGEYTQSAREDFDSALLNYAIDLSIEFHLDEGGFKPILDIPARELKKRFPFSLGQTNYYVRSLEGKILSKGKNILPIKEVPYVSNLPMNPDYTHRFLTISDGENNYRAVNLKVTNDHGQALILQAATPASILEEQENRLFLINVFTIPLLIAFSSLASYVIAGNALVPIKTVTETANNIAAKNLSLRVPHFDTGDEVAELSNTFNTLLDRLEKSFKAQEHFVANASHQLNTPLAIIKGELDVLESKDRNIEDYHRFQKSLREEVERLIELVQNMLLVSRVESGQENFIFHPMRIDEILLATTSRLSLKSKDKKINLRFNIDDDLDSDSFEIMGERQLLNSLFENILDNAIKYSPEESTIKIDILSRDFPLEVWIQDQGPGMSTQEFNSIINGRFQRSSKSLIPGTGIGLSLAAQIAAYHHGQISYESLQPQGSLFKIQFSK
jgi:signal transduction histidine kinase